MEPEAQQPPQSSDDKPDGNTGGTQEQTGQGQHQPSPVQQPAKAAASSATDPAAVPSVQGLTAAHPAAQSDTPQIADDTDLIEKEWIDKAKEIVARTAHDPYLQNQEINKIRSDYLKKRYNKTLKQGDKQAE